jgi:hypothetical protein
MNKVITFEREHPTKATGSGKYELKEKKMYVLVVVLDDF